MREATVQNNGAESSSPTSQCNVPEKQLVVSSGISKTSYEEVVYLVSRWARERKSSGHPVARYICLASAHPVITASQDPLVGQILNDADIAAPDGMPVVWAMRSFGVCGQQRVYGPTLMLEICLRAAMEGLRIFLYGTREETLAALSANLRKRFPGLLIAGTYAPPFRELTEAEKQDVERQIRDSDADIVFVGISTPKQERWMYEFRSRLPGLTLIGVGAAFDFHSGRIHQAPSWIQRSGLEWLFRLCVEPTRLWRRYLLVTPRFLPLWAKQKWQSRKAG
jgi:N-acetylglucosaminyldiphosphoundecaprenol N-acetyl-beta-D-mannosaminyltransferase